MAVTILHNATYFTDTGVNDPTVNTSTHVARNIFESKCPSTAIRNQLVPFFCTQAAVVVAAATDIIRLIRVPKGAKLLTGGWAATTGAGSCTARFGWESAAATQFLAATDIVTAQTGVVILQPLIDAQIATTAEDHLSLTFSAVSGCTVAFRIWGAWYIP